jgi:hypothetical protein
MKLRAVVVAAFVVSAAVGPAIACTGEVLFVDDFSDPALSKAKWKEVWADYPESLSFTKGYMEMRGIWGGTAMIPNIEKDFDLCVDITIPKVKRPKIGAVAEITVVRQDKIEYIVSLGADGVILTARTSPSGDSEYLTPDNRTYPGVKVGAGQKNSWRLVVKDNRGTFYGNDRQLFEFPLVGQEVSPTVRLHGSSNDQSDGPWRFSDVKVTKPAQN